MPPPIPLPQPPPLTIPSFVSSSSSSSSSSSRAGQHGILPRHYQQVTSPPSPFPLLKLLALNLYLFHSGDDYYTTDFLAAMETTNPVFNSKLYDWVSPQTLPCWMRSFLACRLAVSASDWASIFSRYFSGCYASARVIYFSGIIVLTTAPAQAHTTTCGFCWTWRASSPANLCRRGF
jgi:hypothetical protein